MNYSKYIIGILITLPLLGDGGTPADITLGELQTLQKKIEGRKINPTDAQSSFQSLTTRLSSQEKEKYKKTLNDIIESARKRGIILTLGAEPLQPASKPSSFVEQLQSKAGQQLIQKPADTMPLKPIVAPAWESLAVVFYFRRGA